MSPALKAAKLELQAAKELQSATQLMWQTDLRYALKCMRMGERVLFAVQASGKFQGLLGEEVRKAERNMRSDREFLENSPVLGSVVNNQKS